MAGSQLPARITEVLAKGKPAGLGSPRRFLALSRCGSKANRTLLRRVRLVCVPGTRLLLRRACARCILPVRAGGTIDTSPAIHRWESGCSQDVSSSRRDDWSVALSIPDVPLVVLDPVPLQEREELLLESLLAMVFGLRLNVADRSFHLGNADAERAVSFLPGKIAVFGEGVMDPPGGTALDQLNGLGDRQGGRRPKE